MTIETHESGDVQVLACSGAMTVNDGRDAMIETVDRLLAAGERRFVLDVRQVPYMDSAAIGGVVVCVKRTAQQGGEMLLATGPDGKVRELLALTGLDEVLRVFDDVERAVAAFDEARA